MIVAILYQFPVSVGNTFLTCRGLVSWPRVDLLVDQQMNKIKKEKHGIFLGACVLIPMDGRAIYKCSPISLQAVYPGNVPGQGGVRWNKVTPWGTRKSIWPDGSESNVIARSFVRYGRYKQHC